MYVFILRAASRTAAVFRGSFSNSRFVGLGMGVATTSTYPATPQAVSVEQRAVALGYLTTADLVGLAASPVIAGRVGSLSMRGVFYADALGLGLLAWVVWRKMRASHH